MTVLIEKLNDTYVRVHCKEPSTKKEIDDFFSFTKPGFIVSKKQWMWLKKRDGKQPLFNDKNSTLPVGLMPRLTAWLRYNKYEYTIEGEFASKNFSEVEAKEFIKTLNIPEKYVVRDYQMKYFIKCVRNQRAVVISPTNCHAKGDKVLSSNGWINVEDIKIGDKIIGADGKEKRVLETFTGQDDLYKIHTGKASLKSPITVTKNHVLPLKFSDYKEPYGYAKGDKDHVEYVTVEEYINKPKYYKHCAAMFYNDQAIEYDNHLDSKLSPYFIGLYLGDGSSHNCEITTKDPEVVEEIKRTTEQFGLSNIKRGEFGYGIKGERLGGNRRNPIFQELENIGIIFGNTTERTKCNERFIPQSLFNISIRERLELLAGLIDSDGYLSNNTYYEYSSKSLQLSNDIQRLSISLGLSSAIKPKFNKKYNTMYYSTYIYGNINKIPVRIERKIQKETIDKKNLYRRGISNVEYVGKGDYFGFHVEDELYITNDGLITHNSGKSLVIYLLFRYFNQKTLLTVPITNLVYQMYGDFKDYGYDVENNVHLLTPGESKVTDKLLTITCWQSIYTQKKQFFKDFRVVFGDEVHTNKAESLISIMNMMDKTPIRIGLTGSMTKVPLFDSQVEGCFGPTVQYVTNNDLIEQGFSSPILIKALELHHNLDMNMLLEYQDEVKYLLGLTKRNDFFVNLALSLKGNTFLMFRIREHGMRMYEDIKARATCPVYYVDGTTSAEERNNLKKIIESTEECIVLASIVFATGVNISSINNIIFTHPTKSRVKVLQSIGRGLRKSERKKRLVLFDVYDILSDRLKNTTLRHFWEREEIYKQEQFPIKPYTVSL